ncbi:hypothetical protein Scep_005363 [Stephania cephalantha]|uniref:Delta(14)-sterol reductase n=1 Tax=Stephania cephalantha TaxID=152367 RepID=A0AAP0KX32_9MAGN
MDFASAINTLIPSWISVFVLLSFFAYLAIAGSILPGKSVPGATLPDGTRIHYICNGLQLLVLLVGLLGNGVALNLISPTVIADRGLELLSATFLFSIVVTLLLYVAGRMSHNRSSSLKPHISGNFIHDWWFGIQLNPHFAGIDLKNDGVAAYQPLNSGKKPPRQKLGHINDPLPVICLDGNGNRKIAVWPVYVVKAFWLNIEFLRWDIIAERLGFMLVFGDLVWIPFTFSIQGWWLLSNKVELTTAAAIANCLVFLIGYCVFRGANKQKHIFKKNPKALIWGRPPKVIGGKLLASGYWGMARHCNYLGDLLLALSFSLPCGASSPVPYFYPIYLFILLIWRERRDEARCSEKYKEIWAEYCKLVPWRILPYVY